MVKRTSFSLILAFALSAGLAMAQEPTLTNDAVATMMKIGISTDNIKYVISHQPVKFDTGLRAMTAMKKAGATEEIILAMMFPSPAVPLEKATVAAVPTPKQVVAPTPPVLGSGTLAKTTTSFSGSYPDSKPQRPASVYVPPDAHIMVRMLGDYRGKFENFEMKVVQRLVVDGLLVAEKDLPAVGFLSIQNRFSVTVKLTNGKEIDLILRDVKSPGNLVKGSDYKAFFSTFGNVVTWNEDHPPIVASR